MDEKVAIVKKIIYRPYLDSIDRIVYFCGNAIKMPKVQKQDFWLT